ncbi:MAG: hypothetical protein RLZZ59_146 [Pseudomonadota bacterium]|jgi:hypothetical protein
MLDGASVALVTLGASVASCLGALGVNACRNQYKKNGKSDEKNTSDQYTVKIGLLEVDGAKIKVSGLEYSSSTSNTNETNVASIATSRGYSTTNTNIVSASVPGSTITSQPQSANTNTSSSQAQQPSSSAQSNVQGQDPEIHASTAQDLSLIDSRDEFDVGEIAYEKKPDGSISYVMKNTTIKTSPQETKASAASDNLDSIFSQFVNNLVETVARATTSSHVIVQEPRSLVQVSESSETQPLILNGAPNSAELLGDHE